MTWIVMARLWTVQCYGPQWTTIAGCAHASARVGRDGLDHTTHLGRARARVHLIYYGLSLQACGLGFASGRA